MIDVLSTVRDSARLRYWLGPWAPAAERPERVTLRDVRGLHAGSRLYAPLDREPRGAFLISPGLHYEGPSDPRMDRLARIFASAGFVVMSPAVPDLMQLRLTPAVTVDVARALEALLDAPELPAGCRPAIFSVSVGSLAALRVASIVRFSSAISHLVVFGGYADPIALIRSLTLEPRDPLNRPAAMLTLLEHLPGAPASDGADAELLREAWREMVRTTWPHPALKVPGGTLHHPIARAIAGELPSHLQPLFAIGCGVLPGAWELCEAALASPGDPYAYLDPRPHLEQLACPVTIVHGVADDVIPFEQAGELGGALPAAVAFTTLATGLLAHSNAVAPAGRAMAVVRELRTFNRICRAIGRS